VTAVKRKIGTIVEEDLFLKAKQKALEQKMPLNLFIEEALKKYFQGLEEQRRGKGVVSLTRGTMKIPKATLKKIMEEEGWYETG
jgi:hypothetical protein